MKHVVAVLVLIVAVSGSLAPRQAAGADGCTVLLCLAGNWRNISQCVPPVREVLRDIARGRAFPSCGMGAGAAANGTGASNRMLGPADCPPQFLVAQYYDGTFTGFACSVTGAVSVMVNGALWTTTYWDMAGNSVTQYSPAARAQLGEANVDPAFDDGVQAWMQTPAYVEWNCIVNRVCPPPPADTGSGA